jgi:hypothetical protein
MQKINLYIAPPPVEVVILPFPQAMLVLGAAAGVFVAISTLEYMSVAKLRNQLKELEIKATRLASDVETVKANIPNNNAENNTLEQKVENLGKINDTRAQMFQELNKLDSKGNAGFAAYFYALAKYDMTGIWLVKFSFLKGGSSIILEGRADKPSAIPKLIDKLGSDPVFKNKSFQSLNINRDAQSQDGTIGFTLTSD